MAISKEELAARAREQGDPVRAEHLQGQAPEVVDTEKNPDLVAELDAEPPSGDRKPSSPR